MNGAEETAVTYRYERWRAMTTGVLETAGTTFLLLLAVRWFQAGATAKALVAAGGSMGLLISPLVVWLVSRRGWLASHAAAWLSWVGAFAFLVMAALPYLPFYVLGSLVTMTMYSAIIPLMTQIYQENYPERQRGKLFSRTVMIRIAMAAIFSDLAGRFLTGNLQRFQWLLLVFGAAFCFAGFCLKRIPSRRILDDGGSHPLRALRFARLDRLFRHTLICWMMMGFANLMMFPLRVEYLANPKYSLQLDVATIAFVAGVVPNLARLAVSPLWGWLFDRMNFFALRVILNLGFALGILAFFTTDSMTGLIVGALVFGMSHAGGDVAWSLWVTKFAPPERVAEYMSVHTFFTGLRGVVAPLIAFSLATRLPLSWLATFSIGLILAASAMLIPEIKFDRARKKAAALVEEVSE